MGKTNIDRVLRRKRRISRAITGSKEKPRLAVFRSNRYIYVQAIDDETRVTLATYSSLQADKKKMKKTDNAKEVGIEMGKLLQKKGIKTAVFDRNRYTYKGRVKALAEGLREAGLLI